MPPRKASCCLLLLFLAVSTFAMPIKRRQIPPVRVAEELAPNRSSNSAELWRRSSLQHRRKNRHLYQTPPAKWCRCELKKLDQATVGLGIAAHQSQTS
ncbi:uncharacterized protein UDID_19359 [Ustilago sp. UG-2017a]|nr:uncharacterized protein UDID_19359 [Ustilago sp. UG-2017a]